MGEMSKRIENLTLTIDEQKDILHNKEKRLVLLEEQLTFVKKKGNKRYMRNANVAHENEHGCTRCPGRLFLTQQSLYRHAIDKGRVQKKPGKISDKCQKGGRGGSGQKHDLRFL